MVFADRNGIRQLERDREVEETLVALRARQFEQIKAKVRGGASPTWDDFVCATDLSILLAGRDNRAAREVVEWQRAEAAHGGWTGYMPCLDEFLDLLRNGHGYSYQLYVAKNGTFPEEFRYGRRLPSFQGPPERGVQRWR